MGFNIGKIFSSIKLPKIDLGSIGKAVLSEGKKVLGQIAKDAFQLGSKDSKNIFDQNLDFSVLGEKIRLPNPIAKLGNKLLGKAGDALKGFGVDVDFKALLGKLFKLPQAGGTSVEVPSMNDRIQSGELDMGQAEGADAVGGGAVQASAATGAASAASGANAVGGGTAASGGGVEQNMLEAAGGVEAKMNDAMDKLSKLDPDSKTYQQDMMKLQKQMQNAQQLLQMISQMLSAMHQSKQGIIQNMRA